MKNKTLFLSTLACLSFCGSAANAAITLYSSNFGGGTGELNGTAVNTSGATGAQHTQYGTVSGETWTAATKLKANGTYTSWTSGNEGASATLAFAPQNGYVYTLTMTTDLFIASSNIWFGVGFFETDNYTGAVGNATGSPVWVLTRPGAATGQQEAHYNVNGGVGNQTGAAGQVNDPTPTLDTTAPSTLTIVLDTTAGTGDWSAQYFQGSNLLGTVSDLGDVQIQGVGIGTFAAADTGAARFQSFELSVVPEPSTALLGLLGAGLLLRRRR